MCFHLFFDDGPSELSSKRCTSKNAAYKKQVWRAIGHVRQERKSGGGEEMIDTLHLNKNNTKHGERHERWRFKEHRDLKDQIDLGLASRGKSIEGSMSTWQPTPLSTSAGGVRYGDG